MRSLNNYFSFRNRRFFTARCLIVVLLITAMVIPIASNTGSAQSPKTQPQRPKSPLVERAKAMRQMRLEADSDKPHTLAASYYSLRGNLKATLMLNNKGPKPLEVSPSLFSIYGDRFDAPPVTVEGNSFLEVDLSQWAAAAGPLFQEGSLQVFYKGPDLLLGSQVKLVDQRFSLMSDEQLVEPGAMFKSSRLEGVWWLPANHCRMNLVLSNTTDEGLSVAVALAGRGLEGRDAFRLWLHPRETRVIDVRELAGKKSTLPETGGISIEHSGRSGALLARGVIEESAMGYSSAIQFVDPANGKSSRLHGAGLRLGRVAGEELTPVIVARNIGGRESTLTGRIPYTMSDGSRDVIPISRVTLGPGEVRVLSLDYRMSRPQREGDVSAGLELEYDTAPGSVVVSVLSTSLSRDHVFGLPMSDPAAQQSSTGGYPWRIEKGSSTFVYVKNVTGKSQQYHLQLSYEVEGQDGIAGLYSPGLVTIEGGQSVAVDIRRLRDEQVADEAGRLIPAEASRGQVLWSVRGKENLTLIGRAEQADFSEAVSSTYGCQNCCPDSFYDGFIDPQGMEGGVGDTLQFTAEQQDQNCYGTILITYVVFADWDSSNENVATIDGDGLAIAEGPGEATMQATWYVVTWLLLVGFPECEMSEQQTSTTAQVVADPVVTVETISFGTNPVNRNGGNSAVTVGVSASTGFPANSSVTVEAWIADNPSGVSISVSNPITQPVTAGQFTTFVLTASCPAGATVTGDVKIRARILSAPAGVEKRPAGGLLSGILMVR